MSASQHSARMSDDSNEDRLPEAPSPPGESDSEESETEAPGIDARSMPPPPRPTGSHSALQENAAQYPFASRVPTDDSAQHYSGDDTAAKAAVARAHIQETIRAASRPPSRRPSTQSSRRSSVTHGGIHKSTKDEGVRRGLSDADRAAKALRKLKAAQQLDDSEDEEMADV